MYRYKQNVVMVKIVIDYCYFNFLSIMQKPIVNIHKGDLPMKKYVVELTSKRRRQNNRNYVLAIEWSSFK